LCYKQDDDKKKSMKKKTTKSKSKPNLMVELTNKKMAEQKSGEKKESFGKFKPGKERNKNTSSVGPSWGGRKGN